jgi:tetratricopeptide (TPR) repeat protein
MIRLVCLLAFGGVLLLGGCARPVETFRKEGIRLYKAEQYEQAMTAFDKALADDQFDAASNAYSGVLHYRRGELEQAEYHCRVALNADPSNEMAKECLTETLIKKGKPDEALDALERAAKMAEKVDDPRWEQTLKRPYTKQVEERLFLGQVEDRMRIARAYQALGDYDNAIKYYDLAFEKSGSRSAAALLSAGEVYAKSGNKPKAQEYLTKAYRLDPGTPGLTEAMTRNGVAISNILPERPE